MMDLFTYNITRVQTNIKNNHNDWRSYMNKELLKCREGSMHFGMNGGNDLLFHPCTA